MSPRDDTDRLLALLAYLIGLVGPVIALAMGGDRPYAKFHALQALIAQVAVTVLLFFLSFVPFFGYGVSLLGLLATLFFIYCGIRAYQGEAFEIPVAADWARGLGGGR